MIDFNKAKEKYESVEIPHELEEIINEAVAVSKEKKSSGAWVHFIRLAPVAVCAIICFAIGITALPGVNRTKSSITVENGGAAGGMLARNNPVEVEVAESDMDADSIPVYDEYAGNFKQESATNAVTDFGITESAASKKVTAYNASVAAKIDKSVEESVRLEMADGAYGEVCELYSDEEVYSYCVTTYPSNAVNYYNIYQSDGSDIPIEDVVDDVDYDSENCIYYFKERKKLVIICDDEEREVTIN